MADVSVVIAGDATFDVHPAGRDLTFLILEILEVEGLGISVDVNIYHATGLSLGVKLINSHCKFSAVREVVCNGILATDIVADLDGAGLADLAKFVMSMLILGHVDSGGLYFFCVKVMEYSFGNNHSSVRNTQEFSLEDG